MKVIPSRLSTIFSALLFALIITPSLAQDAEAAGDPAKGKQLFNQNCAACHALNRKMRETVGVLTGGGSLTVYGPPYHQHPAVVPPLASPPWWRH